MKNLTLEETRELVKAHDGKEEVEIFLKGFITIKPKDVQEMRKELNDLNNVKLNQEHIVKIIDFLPEDASDINKIFIDISLEEDEIKQILDIVKKYK